MHPCLDVSFISHFHDFWIILNQWEGSGGPARQKFECQTLDFLGSTVNQYYSLDVTPWVQTQNGVSIILAQLLCTATIFEGKKNKLNILILILLLAAELEKVRG